MGPPVLTPQGRGYHLAAPVARNRAPISPLGNFPPEDNTRGPPLQQDGYPVSTKKARPGYRDLFPKPALQKKGHERFNPNGPLIRPTRGEIKGPPRPEFFPAKSRGNEAPNQGVPKCPFPRGPTGFPMAQKPDQAKVVDNPFPRALPREIEDPPRNFNNPGPVPLGQVCVSSVPRNNFARPRNFFARKRSVFLPLPGGLFLVFQSCAHTRGATSNTHWRCVWS